MPTTTTWQLPYPVPGDHTRTWEYWQALAEKVDTQLTALRNSIKAGIPTIQTNPAATPVSVPISGTGATATVTFPTAFAALPNLAFNITTNNAAVIGWIARGITVSGSGFTLALNGPTATSTFAVQWTAILATTTPLALAAPLAADIEGWHLGTATCRNPDCPNNDNVVPDLYLPDVPADWNWRGVSCGACGQPVEDIA